MAAINISTLPLPLPLWPAAIVIQLTPEVAVQLQPLSVETPTSTRPPSAPIESPDRLSETSHGAAA